MPVRFYNDQINFLPKNVPRLKEWISKISSEYDKHPGELSFIFTTDSNLLEINQKYLHHDFFTDIISFDYSVEDLIAGDIFISIERVKENSLKFGTGFNEELKRVIIHGVLHLCGYHDSTDQEKSMMRKIEKKSLEYVKDLLIV